ncbi:HAD-IIB family hydrolase [Granulicella cerasi]|uniref:HAD-IIB family hydrolase n=1 Tax=Granulicella cerasi TaxID=741063 RepID=A0ABW1Z6W7_9BACT|nr:HAD-IIB family hydrolase [Granulicella cerasi]
MISNDTPPRLIAIDMDGTLLNSEGQVSSANRAAIRAAEEAGCEVVIATGRRHSFAMQPLRTLGLNPAHALISSNGTVIRSVNADLLHRSHLSVASARWLVEHADEFRSAMVFTFDRVQPSGFDHRGALVALHEHELNDNIGRWMEANRPYFEYVDKLESSLANEDDAPIQAMLCGSLERMEAALNRLLESQRVAMAGEETDASEITIHRTAYPGKDLMIVDILPARCSKASALEILAKMRGCTAEDVVAIGDNWNDLPMLEYAGRPIVMANAVDSLLDLGHERGWLIAPSNDEDGVQWAIEQCLANPAQCLAQPAAGA